MPRFYALRTLFLRQSLGSRPTESLADVRCCALRALDGVATFEPCACVKVAPGWPLGLVAGWYQPCVAGYLLDPHRVKCIRAPPGLFAGRVWSSLHMVASRGVSSGDVHLSGYTFALQVAKFGA